jgi:hypothetical protein
MENAIIIIILMCIVGSILFYLYRQKKRGMKCVGCPYCKQCSGHCGTGGTSRSEKK